MENFDCKSYVSKMSVYFEDKFPEDIKEKDRKYIVNLISQFAILAFESMDEENKYTIDETLFITQLLMDQTYCIGVDLLRFGIELSIIDKFLKDIAFVIFEIYKQAIDTKLTDWQILSVVEHHIFKANKNIADELLKNKEITKEEYNKITSLCNAKEKNYKKIIILYILNFFAFLLLIILCLGLIFINPFLILVEAFIFPILYKIERKNL